MNRRWIMRRIHHMNNNGGLAARKILWILVSWSYLLVFGRTLRGCSFTRALMSHHVKSLDRRSCVSVDAFVVFYTPYRTVTDNELMRVFLNRTMNVVCLMPYNLDYVQYTIYVAFQHSGMKEQQKSASTRGVFAKVVPQCLTFIYWKTV